MRTETVLPGSVLVKVVQTQDIARDLLAVKRDDSDFGALGDLHSTVSGAEMAMAGAYPHSLVLGAFILHSLLNVRHDDDVVIEGADSRDAIVGLEILDDLDVL